MLLVMGVVAVVVYDRSAWRSCAGVDQPRRALGGGVRAGRRGDALHVTAAVLDAPGRPLRAAEVAAPEAGPGPVALRVSGLRRLRPDLHIRDGEVEAGHLPLILGHQIVALDEDGGGSACPGWGGPTAPASTARSRRENLCVGAKFTGRDIDGGYAE